MRCGGGDNDEGGSIGEDGAVDGSDERATGVTASLVVPLGCCRSFVGVAGSDKCEYDCGAFASSDLPIGVFEGYSDEANSIRRMENGGVVAVWSWGLGEGGFIGLVMRQGKQQAERLTKEPDPLCLME